MTVAVPSSNRVNQTGRRKSELKFVMIDEYVLASAAYRNLGVYSRALHVQIKRRHNGSNNGSIHMSLQDAARLCNCSEKPMRAAFVELQEKGFIKIVTKGAFSRKSPHATEYELTECSLGKEKPNKDFMQWKAKK